MISIEQMKYYYKNGLWSVDRFDTLLRKGIITREQYDDIMESKEDSEE